MICSIRSFENRSVSRMQKNAIECPRGRAIPNIFDHDMPSMFGNEIGRRTWKNTRRLLSKPDDVVAHASGSSDVMFFGDHAQSKHWLLIVGVGVCMPRW